MRGWFAIQFPMPDESSSSVTKPWTIADLVDFEYLLAVKGKVADEVVARQADELFKSTALPVLQSNGNPSRRDVFRSWLDTHREVAEEPLPGEHWKAAWHLTIALSTVAGFVIGGGMAGALLLYHGEVPVNVMWFLVLTLGVQILVLIVAGLLWLLRFKTDLLDGLRPLGQLPVSVVSWCLGKLSGHRRERLWAIFGRMHGRREVYGSLAAWPFVIVTQQFGVAFNVGILLALLAHGAFKDIEFGWQSSYFNSESVYNFTWWWSLPWQWAPHPHPTLVEIAESHFRYKERQSNTAWWPFLFYSIAFYGLLVRCLLLLVAGRNLRCALDRLEFKHGGCSSLFRRLIGPTVRSPNGSAPTNAAPAPARISPSAVFGNAVALVEEEINVSNDLLTAYVREKLGWELSATLSAQIDHPSGNASTLAAIKERAANLVGVIVAVPAERPPIKATAVFLKMVLEEAGAGAEVVLLLVGQQQASGFSAVDQANIRYWQNLVDSNNLRISLESWSGK